MRRTENLTYKFAEQETSSMQAMSNGPKMLNIRLKQKLPKPAFPEEYLKHILVLDAQRECWKLQCNHCLKLFTGRAHRANCHLIGKVGEGVEVCNEFPEQAGHDSWESCSNSSLCCQTLDSGEFSEHNRTDLEAKTLVGKQCMRHPTAAVCGETLVFSGHCKLISRTKLECTYIFAFQKSK